MSLVTEEWMLEWCYDTGYSMDKYIALVHHHNSTQKYNCIQNTHTREWRCFQCWKEAPEHMCTAAELAKAKSYHTLFHSCRLRHERR